MGLINLLSFLSALSTSLGSALSINTATSEKDSGAAIRTRDAQSPRVNATTVLWWPPWVVELFYRERRLHLREEELDYARSGLITPFNHKLTMKGVANNAQEARIKRLGQD